MAETFVQIEVPRTGQKIRNTSFGLIQPDGTTGTMLAQVVAVTDDAGNLLSTDDITQVLKALLVESRVQTEILLRVLSALDPAEETTRAAVMEDLDIDPDLTDPDTDGEPT